MEIKKLDSRQKLVFGVIAGLMTILIAFSNFNFSKQATANVSTEKKPSEGLKIQPPVMPKGYNTPTVTRDPFSLPTELRSPVPAAQNDQKVSSGSGASSRGAKAMDDTADLKLTGIAGSQSARVAVIKSGNRSKAYQLNDFIGVNRLTAINEESVVLVGPAGERTLYIDRTPQKGGNVVAK